MGLGSFLKKAVKVAIPAALAYFTGGASLALTSAGASIASGALKSTPKQSAITGMTGAATSATGVDPSVAAAEDEKKKRLALNASGSSGNTTSPLGVVGQATVTKRNLLGL